MDCRSDRLEARSAIRANPEESYFSSTILSLLQVDVLACGIDLQRLIGTYPLCFHLGVQKNMDIIARVQRPGRARILGGTHPSRGCTLIINDVNTTGKSVLQIRNTLKDQKLLGALFIYDRLEGGREILEEQDIPTLSLMSLRSLRRFCGRVLGGYVSVKDLDSRARTFLRRSGRIRIKVRRFRAAMKKCPTIALAPGLSPHLRANTKELDLDSYGRRAILRKTMAVLNKAVIDGCSMAVFPELTVPVESRRLFERMSLKEPIIVVAGCEYNTLGQNCALIAIEGRTTEQPKLVRSWTCPHF